MSFARFISMRHISTHRISVYVLKVTVLSTYRRPPFASFANLSVQNAKSLIGLFRAEGCTVYAFSAFAQIYVRCVQKRPIIRMKITSKLIFLIWWLKWQAVGRFGMLFFKFSTGFEHYSRQLRGFDKSTTLQCEASSLPLHDLVIWSHFDVGFCSIWSEMRKWWTKQMTTNSTPNLALSIAWIYAGIEKFERFRHLRCSTLVATFKWLSLCCNSLVRWSPTLWLQSVWRSLNCFIPLWKSQCDFLVINVNIVDAEQNVSHVKTVAVRATDLRFSN